VGRAGWGGAYPDGVNSSSGPDRWRPSRSRGRTVLAIALTLCSLGGTLGCGDDSTAPTGPTASGTAVTSEQLESTLTELRNQQGAPWGQVVPGLAATVTTSEDDQVAESAAVSGVADPPGSTPLTDRDRFHVGSITKTFTAALIMQLDQDGVLSLDDTISNWIDFPNGDEITVEMLLGHTSGIPEYYTLDGFDVEAPPEESVALAGTAPLLFVPGSAFEYANSNYLLLGLIAEEITGSTWEQEVRTRFLEPLALTDTYVWTGEPEGTTVTGARAECDEIGEPSCEPTRPLPQVPVTDSAFWTTSWAAGAMVSTSRDLARWMRALVEGDVVDRDHVDLMITPTPESIEFFAESAPNGPLKVTGTGLGLITYEIDGVGTAHGHNGQVPGFIANAAHLLDASLTVAFTSNFEQTDGLATLGELTVSAASGES